MRIQFNNTTEKHAIDSFISHCKALGKTVKSLSIVPVHGCKGCFVVYTKA